MLCDSVGEPVNRFVQGGSQRLDGELLEGLHQSMGEAMQAVTQTADAIELHVVQDFAHLLGSKFLMIDDRDEVGDRPLAVDVVLPYRVVVVDEQNLWRERHFAHGTSLC